MCSSTRAHRLYEVPQSPFRSSECSAWYSGNLSVSEIMSIKDGNWSLNDCLGECMEQILNSGKKGAREDTII